ncbi:hypothetical protein COOONC_23098 [Cooperia oncophora]
MGSISGREGRTFNFLKDHFLGLPRGAKRFWLKLMKVAYYQVTGKLSKKRATEIAFTAYHKLPLKDCKALEDSEFADMTDFMG